MRLGGLIARTRKVTAFAAIFGILLQLALAATHHHADLFGAPVALAGQKAVTALPDGNGPPLDDGACRVCLGLAFGTAFILPATLLLDLPPAADTATLVVQRVPDARTHLAFQSRAPPHRL